MSDPNAQSAGTSVESQQAEAARRQVNQIAEEVAQLAEAETTPAQFYSDFLQRLYFAVQGFAGAVWIRTGQGNLLLQCQINLREVGLDRTPESRPMHDELLRQSALQAKGGVIRPNVSHALTGAQDKLAGNPTDFVTLIVPILHEKQVIGLLEIWQDPARPPAALNNVYQFMVRMAAFVSIFNRNHQLRQMLGQQELWQRLEAFSRQIHGSMHTTEVAYLIANEGRRLIEVDRISVATRSGDKCAVTAISGADVVEKRSNLVQLMRALFDAVIQWGEMLVYTGTKDEALPPKVLDALDGYLNESNSKILVVLPLVDERDKEYKRSARSALMMECFETNQQPEQLTARLEVVGRHACSALYNAMEYRRIPMRFLWLPLAYLQDGLGGKAKAITAAVAGGLTILVLSLIFLELTLKMEANGQALPRDRIWVFSPEAGKVESIMPGLKSGSEVKEGRELLVMHDFDLAKRVTDLKTEIAILTVKANAQGKTSDGSETRGFDQSAVKEAQITLDAKIELLKKLRRRTNCSLLEPGRFSILAPKTGIVLNADFRENLVGRLVKPNEPLIRIGFTDPVNPDLEDWELELKISHKHVGQVLRAYETLGMSKELDVDVLFVSEPTQSFRAKLQRNKIAKQANVQKDDNNEPEPVVLAWARVESKYKLSDKAFDALRGSGVPDGIRKQVEPMRNTEFETRKAFLNAIDKLLNHDERNRHYTALLRAASAEDIPFDQQIPSRLLLSGGEVHTRIRCGNRAMGYCLFYGIHEFVYEKVIFPYWR